jgi:hypothetical protein
MPTFVFHCERCGAKRPFLVHDPKETTVERHCPDCRTMTHWTLQHEERRAGEDRRSGIDRRGPAR